MSTEWGVKLYSNQVDRQPSVCMIDARVCVAVCRTRCPAVQRHSWTGTSPRSRRPTCWSGGAASSVPATKTRCATVRTSSTTAGVCTTRTPASSASESRRRRRRRRRPLLLRRQRRHCRRVSVRHSLTYSLTHSPVLTAVPAGRHTVHIHARYYTVRQKKEPIFPCVHLF